MAFDVVGAWDLGMLWYGGIKFLVFCWPIWVLELHTWDCSKLWSSLFERECCQVCGVEVFITEGERGQGVVLWASCIFISGELERVINHCVFAATGICCNKTLRFFEQGKIYPFALRLALMSHLTSLVVEVAWHLILLFLKKQFYTPCFIIIAEERVWGLQDIVYLLKLGPIHHVAILPQLPWLDIHYATLFPVNLVLFVRYVNMKQVGNICVDSRQTNWLNFCIDSEQTNWLNFHYAFLIYFSHLLFVLVFFCE